jgi:hypothetical protein
LDSAKRSALARPTKTSVDWSLPAQEGRAFTVRLLEQCPSERARNALAKVRRALLGRLCFAAISNPDGTALRASIRRLPETFWQIAATVCEISVRLFSDYSDVTET